MLSNVLSISSWEIKEEQRLVGDFLLLRQHLYSSFKCTDTIGRATRACNDKYLMDDRSKVQKNLLAGTVSREMQDHVPVLQNPTHCLAATIHTKQHFNTD